MTPAAGHITRKDEANGGPDEFRPNWGIPKSTIEVVRVANLIEDIVAKYTLLRPSGRSFVGLCPLHPERTGSFHVYWQDQRCKCYGCGFTGDVFSFLMMVTGQSFPQAVRYLANRAHIDIDSFPRRANSDHKGETAEDIEKATKQLKTIERCVLWAYREGLHRLEHIHWRASDRLRALEVGATERWFGEADQAFEILHYVSGQIRRLEAAYYVVAFGSAGARARFILHPNERETMIDEALCSGYMGNANAIKSARTSVHALLREQPELIQQINRACIEIERWPTLDEINAICSGAFRHE